MSIEEILSALEYCKNEFPTEAVDAALACREEITPALLHIIEDAIQHSDKNICNPTYYAHFFAMYLLAQFRERRAYPLLVEFFSLPEDVLWQAVETLTAEGLDRMLASVCHGDISLIKGLVENEQIDEYVRGAALNALVVLMVEGALTREEVVEYFRSLFHGGLKREYSQIWNALVDYSNDIYPEELMEEIEQAFYDDLTDPRYVDRENVLTQFAAGKEAALEKLAEDPLKHYIVDTKSEMKDWYCFSGKTPEAWFGLPEAQTPPAIVVPQPPAPKPKPVPKLTPAPVRTTPKVGRNQPCSCGSGKKYKQCCGR